ncbi:hypothetical protein JX265_007411 [Neoarthrinium moseri]|uniref:CFEM domain-containing protein n=1 Tax=Neoarthrinium moseri TaxID=1658444 RepID=A0A9P9WKA0_9PEZI|nr:hypothetical protein JX265_007411 [Neoarthrinium moseri]
MYERNIGTLILRVLVWLAAFASLGAAQGSSSAITTALTELPKCALQCLAASIKASPCAISDVTCQCTNAELVSSAELCVMTSCTVEQSLIAKNVTQTMCGAPVRDKTTEYNIVSCTLMGFACAFVLIRLGYKKFFTRTDLGLDDWFILLTLLVCVPSAVINVDLLTANGLGKDIWTLKPDEIGDFAFAFFIITILYFTEVFVLKLSLLFFYLRIFPGKTIRRVILGTVAFDVLFGIGFIVTALLQCRPISYNWTNWRGEGGGQCIDISAVAWANAAVSIALDLWMLAIPLSQLRELKLHWKKKIGVAMMFCVGTFVTVVSAIRLASLVEFRESTNLTWDYWGVSLWSTVEITVGIICACMPSMRLILVRIAPKVFDVSMVRASRYYYAKRASAYPGKWTDPSTQPSEASKNKSAASRQSWMPPNVRTSWRISQSPHDKVFVDGVLFSKVSPSKLEEEDQGRLVPMEDMDPSKYGTDVQISGGASSRNSTPDPGSTSKI